MRARHSLLVREPWESVLQHASCSIPHVSAASLWHPSHFPAASPLWHPFDIPAASLWPPSCSFPHPCSIPPALLQHSRNIPPAASHIPPTLFRGSMQTPGSPKSSTVMMRSGWVCPWGTVKLPPAEKLAPNPTTASIVQGEFHDILVNLA